MKRMFSIIIAITIFVVLLIISFPYLLNSSMGKEAILSKLSQNIHYSLEADKTYFSWFGPQRLEKLNAISSSGVQYKFPELSLDMSLWELYKEIPSIGITRIFNPTVIIPQVNQKTNKSGKSLDSVLSAHKKCSQTNCCKVFGEVHVTDGKVILSELESSFDIPKLQYICNPDKMTLYVEAKLPNSTSISHAEIEYGIHAQNFRLQARDVPSSLFDSFASPWNGLCIEEILGSTVNIDASAELINESGPIFVNLHSPNASLIQSGTLHPRRYLLDKPLSISMKVSEKIIGSIFPNSILQIDAIQRPITITIGPQEISLPLSLCTEIKDGVIHIGKVTCTNKDLLFEIAAQILGIHDSKIDIWFSDIPVCYADGILRISRFEIVLQNKYPIAIWGKIDYFQKKVSLTLAITESTLRKVFGIKYLPPDYIITCPIKGSFDDIQLDIGKLVKKLSILLAKEKTKKQLWKEGTHFFKKPSTIPSPIQSIPGDNK
ncbi:MAG: hypothetical protein ACRCSV_01340 [Chlamydiales bacterium]